MADPPDSPTHIGDLIPDPHNRRVHTPRGVGLITDTLQQVGFARSLVIDEDNVVLCGNATLDACADAGLVALQVVDTDGTTVIAVRRSGLTPAQKQRLAYADNRATDHSTWDADGLALDVAAGVDLSTLFTPKELAAVLSTVEVDLPSPPSALPAKTVCCPHCHTTFALPVAGDAP